MWGPNPGATQLLSQLDQVQQSLDLLRSQATSDPNGIQAQLAYLDTLPQPVQPSPVTANTPPLTPLQPLSSLPLLVPGPSPFLMQSGGSQYASPMLQTLSR